MSSHVLSGDGLGIRPAQNDVALLQDFLRCLPGTVDPPIGKRCHFRDPSANVAAVWIEARTLLHDVKVEVLFVREIGGGEPVDPVGADIVVDEVRLEVRSAQATVRSHLGRKKVGGDDPIPIGDAACLPQFSHGGIDKGNPSQSILPSLHNGVVPLPSKPRRDGIADHSCLHPVRGRR